VLRFSLIYTVPTLSVCFRFELPPFIEQGQASRHPLHNDIVSGNSHRQAASSNPKFFRPILPSYNFLHQHQEWSLQSEFIANTQYRGQTRQSLTITSTWSARFSHQQLLNLNGSLHHPLLPSLRPPSLNAKPTRHPLGRKKLLLLPSTQLATKRSPSV